MAGDIESYQHNSHKHKKVKKSFSKNEDYKDQIVEHRLSPKNEESQSLNTVDTQDKMKDRTEKNELIKIIASKVNYNGKTEQLYVQSKVRDKSAVNNTKRRIFENCTEHGDHKRYSKKKKKGKQEDQEELFQKKTNCQSKLNENGAEVKDHWKHSKNDKKNIYNGDSLFKSICIVGNKGLLETENDAGSHRKHSKKDKKNMYNSIVETGIDAGNYREHFEKDKKNKFKIKEDFVFDIVGTVTSLLKETNVIFETGVEIRDTKKYSKKNSKKKFKQEDIFLEDLGTSSSTLNGKDVIVEIKDEVLDNKRYPKKNKKRKCTEKEDFMFDNVGSATSLLKKNDDIVETRVKIGDHKNHSKKNKKIIFKEEDILFKSTDIVSSLVSQNNIIRETEDEVVHNRKHSKKNKKFKEKQDFVFNDVCIPTSSLKETAVIVETGVGDDKKQPKRSKKRKFKQQDILFEEFDTYSSSLNQKDVIVEAEDEVVHIRKYSKKNKNRKFKEEDISFDSIGTVSSFLKQNNVIGKTLNESMDNRKHSKKSKKRKYKEEGDFVFDDIRTATCLLKEDVILEAEFEVGDHAKQSKENKKMESKEEEITFEEDIGTSTSSHAVNYDIVDIKTGFGCDRKSFKKKTKNKFKKGDILSENISTNNNSIQIKENKRKLNKSDFVGNTFVELGGNMMTKKKNEKKKIEEIFVPNESTEIISTYSKENHGVLEGEVVVVGNQIEFDKKKSKKRRKNKSKEHLLPNKGAEIYSILSKEHPTKMGEEAIVVDNSVELGVDGKESKRKKKKNCKEVIEISVPNKGTAISSIQTKENQGILGENFNQVKNIVEEETFPRRRTSEHQKGKSTHFYQRVYEKEQQKERDDDNIGEMDTDKMEHRNKKSNMKDCFGTAQKYNSVDNYEQDNYAFPSLEIDCKDSDSDSDLELLLLSDKKKFEKHFEKAPRRIDCPQQRNTQNYVAVVSDAEVNGEQNRSNTLKVENVNLKTKEKNQPIQDSSFELKQRREPPCLQDKTTTDRFSDAILIPHTNENADGSSCKLLTDTILQKSLNHPMRLSMKFTPKDREELKKQDIVFNTGVWGLEEKKTLDNNIRKVSKSLRKSYAEVKKLLVDSSIKGRRIRKKYDIYKMLAQGINRQIIDIYYKLRTFCDESNFKGKWTKEEEEKLLRLREKYGNKWTKIGIEFGRSNLSIRHKTEKLTIGGVTITNLEEREKSLGLWKNDEVKRLRQAVEEQKKKNCAQTMGPTIDASRANKTGGISWIAVSRAVKTRNLTQCREKWHTNVSWLKTGTEKNWGPKEFSSFFVELDKCVGKNDRIVDWKIVIKNLGLTETPERLRYKWHRQKQKIPNSQNLSLRGQLDWLLQNCLPIYQSKVLKTLEKNNDILGLQSFKYYSPIGIT